VTTCILVTHAKKGEGYIMEIKLDAKVVEYLSKKGKKAITLKKAAPKTC
jgi:ribosomal protein L24E